MCFAGGQLFELFFGLASSHLPERSRRGQLFNPVILITNHSSQGLKIHIARYRVVSRGVVHNIASCRAIISHVDVSK